MASIYIQRILKFFINIIFPPACFGCGATVQKHGNICSMCHKELHFIPYICCPVYGISMTATQNFSATLTSIGALTKPPPFRRARAVFQHEGLARTLISQLKYSDREDLAPILARYMFERWPNLVHECDIIVPIALHYKRFVDRRYNQAALLARCLARLSDKPYKPNLLKRVKYTKPQTALKSSAREKNVRAAFICNSRYKKLIQNKTILLVDDVYTTGATVKSASKALLQAGANHIDIFTVSNAHKYVI